MSYNSLYQIPFNNIRTQKARGYKALGEIGSEAGVKMPNLGGSYLLPYNYDHMTKTSDPDAWRPYPSFDTGKWFARPCPVTPRHGFVESKRIWSLKEACDLLHTAREEDPDAEVLVVPELSGEYSGIATNMGVTWGRGNDGVTGGTSGSALIPTPFTSPDAWSQLLNLDQHVEGTAYIELVEGDGDMHAVQYRDGPPLPSTTDYIPRKTEVKEILWPMEDLLEWERYLKGKAKTKGVVVQFPKYIALSSHAAVHAIALGIPVINSHLVAVGDVLIPSLNRPKPLGKPVYREIANQIHQWQTFRPSYSPGLDDSINLLLASIATIHTMAAWDDAPHLIMLRSLAVSSLAKYMAMASFGELRHWTKQGPGCSWRGGSIMLTEFRDAFGMEPGGVDRDWIYKEAFRFDTETTMRHLTTAVDDFNHPRWRDADTGRTKCYSCRGDRRPTQAPRKGYAYGGPKWASVAKSALDFYVAIQSFLSDPRKSTWANVIIAANNAVHTSHNGGFALSKWIAEDAFAKIATAPAYGFMNLTACRVALGDISMKNKELTT